MLAAMPTLVSAVDVTPHWGDGALKRTLRASIDSPVGPLALVVEGDAIIGLDWAAVLEPDSHPALDEGLAQLQAYFAGDLQIFDLPLSPKVSAFQKIFGQALCDIPFGETRTYGEMGRALARPAQAIGQACGANPIAIIIPCHRVLAATGLGGFSGAGGVEAKVTLLKHEGAAGLLL